MSTDAAALVAALFSLVVLGMVAILTTVNRLRERVAWLEAKMNGHTSDRGKGT